MTPRCDRCGFRLAVIGVMSIALGLAACGRKGPLDLPPSAIADSTNAPAARADDGIVAPKGQDKRIPLDRLLD